jgi:DNA polymerase-1
MKSLYIIDGHALCYRAYFAFINNPLTNSKGQNISAIYGFSRMMLKLIHDKKPDYLIVAFDPPKKSFRFGLYEPYKANRVKMPDDLRSQIDEIKHVVAQLGIKVSMMDGWEADDVLGSCAKQFAADDCSVILVTGDKDAYQLVDSHVTIYANKKGISEHELYDVDAVRLKLGVEPAQVIEYMALTGDTSDNVPGVKGVGEKTAQKLVSQYGSLDGIYEHLSEIKGKLRETLEANRDMAYLSRDLVTIRTDIELGFSLEDVRFSGFDSAKGSEIFHALEMKTIASEFFSGAAAVKDASPEDEGGKSIADTPHSYMLVRTEEELDAALTAVRKKGRVSVDTETTSVRAVDAQLVGVSMSIDDHQGWYVPIRTASLFGDGGVTLDRENALAALKPVLEDGAIGKIGQNIKYDMIVLSNEGIELRGVIFDDMVASYILDPSERRHNLDDMAADRLHYKTITYEELVGKGKNALTIDEVPVEQVSEYACEDTDIALRLYHVLEKKIRDEGLDKLYYRTELPLVEVLAAMERAGVLIDRNHFAALGKEIDHKIVNTEQEIYRLADEQFNINSTKELSRILFEKLALKTVKKTKTGFSTDISVLEELEGEHEIISHLIAYRTLAKLKGTYVDALPELVSPKTGRIHTSFNQAVVATGRLSSTDPNLQNIPARDEFGRRIREGFVPRKGNLILSADYSQIELRIAAHICSDANMMRAFRDGIDIHTMTASSVFGVPADSVTPEMRRQAKIINFATIYGVSPFGLSKQADISMKDAARFIERYFETYPGFREYIDKTVAFAREHGYVETLLGRRRPVPDITSSAVFRREGAERIAINTPIQGTSADLIKVAMIAIFRDMKEAGMKSKMILQVHDELVFDVDPSEKDELESLVRSRMEHAMTLSVPIIVEMGWGKSWGAAH